MSWIGTGERRGQFMLIFQQLPGVIQPINLIAAATLLTHVRDVTVSNIGHNTRLHNALGVND
jgi:hypothetical protein